jgi:hypothetical protein
MQHAVMAMSYFFLAVGLFFVVTFFGFLWDSARGHHVKRQRSVEQARL